MNKEIKNQIEIATNILNKNYEGSVNGMEILITSNKLNEKARKVTYGFHFEKIGTKKVGDIVCREDKSISRVEAIV